MNRRAVGPCAPDSSPSTPWSGKTAASAVTMACSPSRSATLTGERSAFNVTSTPRWKWRSATAPPARAAASIASTTVSTASSLPGAPRRGDDQAIAEVELGALEQVGVALRQVPVARSPRSRASPGSTSRSLVKVEIAPRTPGSR